MREQEPETQHDSLVLKMTGPLGGSVDLDIGTLVRVLLQPRMAAFLALCLGIFVLLDALAISDTLNLPELVWIWSSTLLLHVLFRLVVDALWAKGQQRFGFFRIWQPLLTHAAFALDSAQFTAQLALFTGVGFSQAFDPTKTVVGYLLTLTTEGLYFIFVLPVLRARAEVSQAEAAPQESDAAAEPERRISVGGLELPVGSLLVLKSAEHHVEVLAVDGMRRVRARLADLVAQTEAEDGVLAHRSHWVARRAIVGLLPGSGSEADTLELVTGERLPVARPRRAAVRDWAEIHLPDAMRDAAE